MKVAHYWYFSVENSQDPFSTILPNSQACETLSHYSSHFCPLQVFPNHCPIIIHHPHHIKKILHFTKSELKASLRFSLKWAAQAARLRLSDAFQETHFTNFPKTDACSLRNSRVICKRNESTLTRTRESKGKKTMHQNMQELTLEAQANRE